MSDLRLDNILAELTEKYGFDCEALDGRARMQLNADNYNNSTGDLNLKDGYNCPLCKNKGYIAFVNDNELEALAPCKCQKVREVLRRANKSGLGEVLSEKTFDKYEAAEEWQNNAKSRCIEFCNDDKAKWFYFGGQVGCVDCDTEYFNGQEWVRIAEYRQGEKVLQYNPETKEATLTTPNKYIVAPSNELYTVTTERKHIDMCLSSNHNFAYVTTKGHMQKKPFSEVMKMHSETTQGFYGKIETAFMFNGKGIELTENEIRLMCAVIADGSFRKGLKFCTVNVKKERKKERMRMLLSNIKHKEYKKPNGYSEFRFYAPRTEKEFTDYWYSCNQSQLQIIADEVFKWDGHINGKRAAFFSTSKKSADFVQFALSATGSRATIGVDNHKEKPCYVVARTSRKSTITMCSTGGKHKAEIKAVKPKDGKQYCFSVDTGYLILRRNGRIFITGNSGKTHLCTAICGHYIKQGRNTLYMSWEDESKKLKALVTDYVAYQSLINEYKNVEVLYIDDLFKTQQGEAPTKADINLAFEIINNRLFSPDKITIISSEKTLNELLDYDEATMSRICEKTGNYKINIGKDIKKNYRLKNSGVTI